jgi:hypothetical protein
LSPYTQRGRPNGLSIVKGEILKTENGCLIKASVAVNPINSKVISFLYIAFSLLIVLGFNQRDNSIINTGVSFIAFFYVLVTVDIVITTQAFKSVLNQITRNHT